MLKKFSGNTLKQGEIISTCWLNYCFLLPAILNFINEISVVKFRQLFRLRQMSLRDCFSKAHADEFFLNTDCLALFACILFYFHGKTHQKLIGKLIVPICETTVSAIMGTSRSFTIYRAGTQSYEQVPSVFASWEKSIHNWLFMAITNFYSLIIISAVPKYHLKKSIFAIRSQYNTSILNLVSHNTEMKLNFSMEGNYRT